MPQPKVYVIFMPLRWKGLYYTWIDCKTALSQCKNGHSFASFKTVAEAKIALQCGTLREYREKKGKTKVWLEPDAGIVLPCLVVDAACSGAPGPVEYRGVILPDGYEAFRHGPYASGTNNIGEYLALITGLRWLEDNTLPFPVYSDSAVAISWIKTHGKCNSHIKDMGRELKDLVLRAESWRRGPTAETMLKRIRKWETDRLGEIPADFGRK